MARNATARSEPYCVTNPKFNQLLRFIGALHDAKNVGYATGSDPLQNFRIANRFGLTTSQSIAVRLSDKINRWFNLMENDSKDKVGESLEATGVDGIVYWMLWLVARAEEQDIEIDLLPR